jgi:hypothetical protein
MVRLTCLLNWYEKVNLLVAGGGGGGADLAFVKGAMSEIFDLSDFYDFTIKSLWGDDFRVKIIFFLKYLGVHFCGHDLSNFKEDFFSLG